MKARTLTPQEEMRLFKGLAVQPFLAVAVAILSFPVVFADRMAHVSTPMQAVFGVAIYVGFGALILTTFCVVPTTVWVVKRFRVSFVQSLAWGLAFANLPIALMTMAAGGRGDSSLLRTHAFVTMIGLTCAAAFWAIAIRGQGVSPDSKSPFEA